MDNKIYNIQRNNQMLYELFACETSIILFLAFS